MILGVNLEVVLEVRLTQKHSVTVFVRTTELLRVFVRVRVSTQLLLRSKRLVTTLHVVEIKQWL